MPDAAIVAAAIVAIAIGLQSWRSDRLQQRLEELERWRYRRDVEAGRIDEEFHP